METLEAIRKRRSRRSFLDKEVEIEKLKTLAEAGSLAPTGVNMQNLRFVIVKDAKTLEHIFHDVLEDGGNYYGAKAIILVLSVAESPLTQLNAGAAAENILLAAEDLGLGAVWIHSALVKLNAKADEMQKLLDLDFPFHAVASVALGYSNAEPKEKENKETIYLR